MLGRRQISCVFVLIALFAALALSAVTISQDGQAKAVIVIAPDAPEPEQHAAKELAAFLGQITGAKFELAGQREARGRPASSSGPAAAKLADEQFSTEGLGAEGIVIRTVGDDLILAGGRPRGTLYAVYTFLEDQLGCRWWSSTESTIPKKPDGERGRAQHPVRPAAGVPVGVLVRRLRRRLGRAQQVQRPESQAQRRARRPAHL